jgi:uncharacterized protein (TIGR03067 family)
MKRLLLSILTVAALATAGAARSDEVAEERKKLVGTWVAVSGETRGEEFRPDQIGNLKVIITEDKIVVDWNQKVSFSYTIDPTTDPKTLDKTSLDGKSKGSLCRGIYSVDGDSLVLCSNTSGTKERPKSFRTTRFSGFSLYLFKRQKP